MKWFSRIKRPNVWVLGVELAITSITPAQALPVAVIAGALGVAATSFVAIAVTAIINIAISVIFSALINAIAGKPQQQQQQRQASVVTLTIGEGPRAAIFGKAAVGGTLCDAFNWGGTHGTDWECLIIALADHKCEALEAVFINDQLIPYPSGGFSGGTVPNQTVTGTQVIDGVTTTTTGSVAYNGQLQMWFLDGSPSQTLPDIVTNGGWSTTGNFGGIALLVVAYKADDPSSTSPVWSGGRPSFLPVVKGKRCYDPRLDSTVGGSGSQRWADPSTWAWSENAAICRYNWVRGIYAKDDVTNPSALLIGRGLTSIEAPEANVFAYANICDEDVALVTGGTEKRYRVGGVVFANERYVDAEKMFADAMGGNILQPGGSVEVEPGHARSTTFALTDDDLIVGSQVHVSPYCSVADNAWCNTVIPRYTEPTQKWQEHAAPVRRNLADVTADGGARELPLSLAQVSSGTQAQRLGEIQRRLGRLVRRATITLGPRFEAIEEGDWGTWTSARHLQGLTITWQVTGYRIDEKRQITLTLREIASTVFDWTASTDEIISDVTNTPVLPVDSNYLNSYGALATLNGQMIASQYPSADMVITATVATPDTISISAHQCVYTDRTVSVASGSLTGTWATGTLVHIYYDDLARAGGAVTYHDTTTAADAAQSSTNPGRHYVGSITIPASGSTSGITAAPPGWDGAFFY